MLNLDHLDQSAINIIIRKGMNLGETTSSYSGFADDDNRETGLRKILEGFEEIYVVGLATDYCVKATANDAIIAWGDNPPKVYIIEDATVELILRIVKMLL